MRGDLLRVARQGLGRSNSRVPTPSRLANDITPLASCDEDRLMICACGADDVALLRPGFKKGRFQMIDDSLDVSEPNQVPKFRRNVGLPRLAQLGVEPIGLEVLRNKAHQEHTGQYGRRDD